MAGAHGSKEEARQSKKEEVKSLSSKTKASFKIQITTPLATHNQDLHAAGGGNGTEGWLLILNSMKETPKNLILNLLLWLNANTAIKK